MEKWCPGSTGLITAYASAASRAVAASGPTWIIVDTVPLAVSNGTRLKVGMRPYRPHRAAGMRMLPPPSAPMAIGTKPRATTTALPLEEPPLTKFLSYGLNLQPLHADVCASMRLSIAYQPPRLNPYRTYVAWWWLFHPTGVTPNSVMTVVPTMMAPRSRKRATAMSSDSAGLPPLM